MGQQQLEAMLFDFPSASISEKSCFLYGTTRFSSNALSTFLKTTRHRRSQRVSSPLWKRGTSAFILMTIALFRCLNQARNSGCHQYKSGKCRVSIAAKNTRWDLRVTVVFKNVEKAFDENLVRPYKKQAFFGYRGNRKSEQHRFELLLALGTETAEQKL